jgi:hypothetical protein
MDAYKKPVLMLWKWLATLSTRQWGVAFFIGIIPPVLAWAQGDLLTSDFVAGLLIFVLVVGAMVGNQYLAREESDNKGRRTTRHRFLRNRRRRRA